MATAVAIVAITTRMALIRNMMAHMLAHCPISPRNESGLAAWYEAHVARATEAMSRAHCSLVLETESPEAPIQLAARFPGTR